VPAAAAWKAPQINGDAETKTETKTKIEHKPIPNAEPSTSASTSTETSADTDAERRIGAKRAGDISVDTDTDQTMGDGPTTKPKEAGKRKPSTNDRLEHGRQMPNPQER